LEESVYQRIYNTIKQIPSGRVASYGQIARMVSNCTPRMVGYALAATPNGLNIPWHRVINSQGKISPRSSGEDTILQLKLLESEGIVFDVNGTTDLHQFGWKPKMSNKQDR